MGLGRAEGADMHICTPALNCISSYFGRPKDLQGCSAARGVCSNRFSCVFALVFASPNVCVSVCVCVCALLYIKLQPVGGRGCGGLHVSYVIPCESTV